jgi:hypothetical protein
MKKSVNPLWIVVGLVVAGVILAIAFMKGGSNPDMPDTAKDAETIKQMKHQDTGLQPGGTRPGEIGPTTGRGGK